MRFEGQHFTLVKVHFPPQLATTSQSATFKITKNTPVRSALKRLYLRFHEHHDVSNYVIVQDPNTVLDEDDFFQGGTNAPRLTYRSLTSADSLAARRTLTLNILVRAEPSAPTVPVPAASNPAAWRRVTMHFDPTILVAKAVRQLDMVAGALDSFGHCGFFVTTEVDGEEKGYWLMENRYPISLLLYQ